LAIYVEANETPHPVWIDLHTGLAAYYLVPTTYGMKEREMK
jgi:hypothetical protein